MLKLSVMFGKVAVAAQSRIDGHAVGLPLISQLDAEFHWWQEAVRIKSQHTGLHSGIAS